MYLDGQLPYGPADTMNPGGQPTPGGNSALDGQPMISGPNPQDDRSGSTFYTIPEGGDVAISPTLADTNGVVPVNCTAPQSAYPAPMSGYADCGSYAASGSLATIASNAGRGMGYEQNQQQAFEVPVVSTPPAPSWLPLVIIGAGILLLGGNSR